LIYLLYKYGFQDSRENWGKYFCFIENGNFILKNKFKEGMMKIVLMYVKAGAGHISAARALSDELKALYNDVEPILYDGLEGTPNFVRDVIEKGYSTASNFFPPIWDLIYLTSKLGVIRSLEVDIVSHYIKENLRNYILNEKPDKIVIDHFFLVKPVTEIVKEEKLRIPVLVIATDPFTCHPIWFTYKDMYLVVFSERMKRYAIKNGIKEDRITVLPIILNRKFNSKLSNNEILELKKKYGFSTDKHMVLIAGGGEGLPRGDEFLGALAKSDMDIELSIVCGRNEILKAKSESIRDRYKDKKIVVYGFVDFMYELMNMSSVVITKGGPATVMEALILEKPLIITSYIWEQEKGNVEFVEENRLGFYETSPKKAVNKVKTLLFDENQVKAFRENIAKANIRNGTTDIAKFIYSFDGLLEQK
jgi:processive 1,2-diacylglycerol beta-glucosyltransferase/1,2-diacylglycerol 3-beta-galactosyltransferase